MLNYDSLHQLAVCAQNAGKKISDVVLEDQADEMGKTKGELYRQMNEQLHIMEQSVNGGIHSEARSVSGLSGGAAVKMKKAADQGRILLGRPFGLVMARALAVAEVNACMGKIVAAPTAGSCGILPAALLSAREELNLPEESVTMALFTAAGVGLVIARRASVSGAEGGCQAECGSATAMAAAALAEMAGGTPAIAENACAIALKNVLGLVCDPVAGLVEIPCIKRNAIGAVNAVAAADMAIAGIESAIPADEVIDAMKNIGDMLPVSLKETSRGGLAATPTGERIAGQFFSKSHTIGEE